MLRKIDTPRYEAYLAGYRIPGVPFAGSADLPASIQPVWTAMQAGASEAAIRNVDLALSENRLFAAEEKAGLLVGLAAAHLQTGATEAAWDNARKSLDLFPYQTASVRIQVQVLSMRRKYMEAYELLSQAASIDEPAIWDTAITIEERQLTLASFSWLMGEWDKVSEHLTTLYAKGLAQMPDEIQEDWFRLSLYRDESEQAAAAAAHLIVRRPVELADQILQTIVQSGWTSEALPLYKDAFDREPDSELLRRRLVALYIKEGELEEARRLTAPGALRTAA